MAERSRAVSIRATKEYIQALKVIAAEKGVHVADLVFAAVDGTHGIAVQEKIGSFFSQGDYPNSHYTESTVKKASLP